MLLRMDPMAELTTLLRQQRSLIEDLLGRLPRNAALRDAGAAKAEAECTLHQERLEEYKFLRTEIESIWNQTYTTVNFTLAAMGILIATAFSQFGEPVVNLPMASILGIGSYRLIRIHTTRVWRIVGYMRCALEPKLDGIRWETRLAARQRILSRDKNRHLDDDIFDGHILILDLLNVAILLGILYASFLGKSALLNSIHNSLLWSAVLSFGAMWPTAMLVMSFLTQRRFKRGANVEARHFESWQREDECGVIACEAEPTRDF